MYVEYKFLDMYKTISFKRQSHTIITNSYRKICFHPLHTDTFMQTYIHAVVMILRREKKTTKISKVIEGSEELCNSFSMSIIHRI